MKLIVMVLSGALLMTARTVHAASAGDAPQLPVTGTRIVNVSTEAQLQSAMGNLQNGDTILLANGTYNLTSSLYINGRNNVTIRGTSGSTNVVLAAKAWTIPVMGTSLSASGPTARTRRLPTSRSATRGTMKSSSTQARSRRASIVSDC